MTLGNLNKGEHVVQFYQKESFLLDTVSDFMRAELGSDTACILIATSAHREALTVRLRAKQIDPSSAQGTYLALDAASTLAQILVDSELSPERFASVIGSIIKQQAAGQQRMRIFEEMTTLLWQQGNQAVALRLETLWNDVCKTEPACSVLCAYSMSLFVGPGHEKSFIQVCDLHARIIPHESYSEDARSEVRQRAISLFQQKAPTFDVELSGHRAMEERLRISEERYRRLFETSTDGILMVDPRRGLIVDANPSMLRLLRSPREQVIDQQLWQVGLMSDQSNQQAFLQRAQEDRGPHSEITQLIRKDGHSRFIEWVSTPFQVEGQAMLQCHVRDITDRKQAEEGLLYLAAIVSSSDDAIIAKDLDGTITSWNPAAERLYGYSAQEIVGQPITLLFPPDRQNEFTQIMERIRRGESVKHYETTRVCKDGNYVHISLTISPIKNSSGTIIGSSGIGRNISERIELEQQWEAFLNLVSHELKTPLTALEGNMQLAQRRITRLLSQAGQFTAEHQRWLEDVLAMLIRTQQPLRTLQRLINDLLDISRLWRDKVELHFAVFNLTRLVKETVEGYQAVHANRVITLDLPQQELIPVHADQDRIQQVLSHYLTNALKFVPESLPIQVGITLAGSTVRVWVQDQGQGLTQEQQKHVWKRYYRVPELPVQEGWKEGLGLGLYICQEFIHRQQGEVGVESTLGQGATFWFSLPIVSDEQTGSSQEPSEQTPFEGP
jgi:PAS domain S-box-containing protein